MIRDDQTSRLVASMGDVLARIAALKKERLYKEAIEDINKSVHTDLGLSPRFVKNISENDLLAMFNTGLISVDRAVVLAKLLTVRAEINWAQNEPNNGLIRTVKALMLYLEAFSKAPDCIFSEYFSDIESLASNLGDYRLPPPTQLKLFHYYDATRKYSKAEDVLFDALENAADAAWVAEGLKFYERLAMKSDGDLAAGNLPREELEESRAELARFESRG